MGPRARSPHGFESFFVLPFPHNDPRGGPPTIDFGHFLRGPRPSMKPHTRHGMSLTYSAHAFWLLVGACNPMLCPNWGCRDPSLRELLPHLQNRYRVELGQGLGMTGTATSTFPPLFYPSFFSPPLLSPSFFFLVLFPPTTWVELTLEL